MKIITSILNMFHENELIIASDLEQETPENAEKIINEAIIENLDNGSKDGNRNC